MDIITLRHSVFILLFGIKFTTLTSIKNFLVYKIKILKIEKGRMEAMSKIARLYEHELKE